MRSALGRATLALCALSALFVPRAASFNSPARPGRFLLSRRSSDNPEVAVTTKADGRSRAKDTVLSLLSSTPVNAPTSKRDTEAILRSIRELEAYCPTNDGKVLRELKGNWELLWTAQDKSSDEWQLGPFTTWINPLENQSYSNNPDGASGGGRANPFLPRPLQDRLEKMGLLKGMNNVRSTQSIDLNKQQVRNVVSFLLPSLGTKPRKATLVVSVDFVPNAIDLRKVDVKFQACRVILSDALDFTIPLDIIGPTGWLRTTYIDDAIRITRGHKGSVFVLSRTSQ